MEKITVVYDGTDVSRLIYEEMQKAAAAEKLDAEIRLFEIEGASGSALSSGSGISEFRGSMDHLARNVGDTSMLLIHLAPVSREILEAAPELGYIGSARSSLVNIDVEEALRRRICVCYAPGRNARTVAEFTLGLILDVTRRISAGDRLIKSGGWTSGFSRGAFNGIELENKTIGLLGFGDIARWVAKLLTGFDVRVLYYDPAVKMEYAGASWVPLDQLLAESDILSLHARAVSEEPLLGARELARMKRGAYLINTARGILLDEDALAAELSSGRLAGAALDVFRREPLEDSPLAAMDNVVLCPHIGGLSRDMAPRSARFVVEDAVSYLKGEPLRRRV